MKKSLRRLLGLGVGLALKPHINAANHGVNVVLINLDDAGNGDFSHKSAIGYLTPNIDRLTMHSSVTFNNAYTTTARHAEHCHNM